MFLPARSMPSAEEDHDHDLPCYIGRRRGHHHRWILWTVNATIRRVQRGRRRVRETTSAASAPGQIGPKRCWTPRLFENERSPPSIASTQPRPPQPRHRQQQQQQL